MGLDNGIRIKCRYRELYERCKDVYKDYNDLYDDKNMEIEVLYWRKCWKVRDIIFTTLREKNDVYEYGVSLKNANTIANNLIQLVNEKDWDEPNSIWRFDEVKNTYFTDLLMFARVCGILSMYDEKDYQITFYDSY